MLVPLYWGFFSINLHSLKQYRATNRYDTQKDKIIHYTFGQNKSLNQAQANYSREATCGPSTFLIQPTKQTRNYINGEKKIIKSVFHFFF